MSVSKKEEEMYRKFPKKRMSSAVMLFNDSGSVLIQKPTYRNDGWLLPGGVIEVDESPRNAAVREVKEEFNITIENVTLCCVNYKKMNGVQTEAIHFVFYGGTLTDEQILKIQTQEDEVREFKFVTKDIAVTMLTEVSKRKYEVALKALENETCCYLES